MNYNDFSSFYFESTELFWQGNHAGINGNRIVSIYEEPPYPAFSSRIWELFDNGIVAFYEWYIPDDVMRFELCNKRGVNFRRIPSIEGKTIEVDNNTFKFWERTLLCQYMPSEYKFDFGIDGIVTYINFHLIQKQYKLWGDVVAPGLEQIYDFSLKIKRYVANSPGQRFMLGIEGKLYAEILKDKGAQSEMNSLRDFSTIFNVKSTELRIGNKLLLLNSLDTEHYKLLILENNFKCIKLLFEDFLTGETSL